MIERLHQEIIIDLSNSNGDHIQLGKKDLIHYQAYEKVEKIVGEHLKEIEKYPSTNTSNLSIFIDGTRGAGKSTFLKNIVKELITINQYKLEKLIYIDPSKIELNEHIFLTLIAQLNQTVIKSRRHMHIHHSDEMDAEYELWRKKLKKIAGGLRLLNSGKNPYDLIDDDVFLDWGLDRADDAMQLHSSFEDLIKHACTILNKKALIILIDDADTHFKKGEQVLEMVRRYLNIPQIIVMMAGDLKLYSNVVRGLYLGNMSENLYKYDQNRTRERSNLLDHMEDQYLKKIFPIQNRISLNPLNKLVKEADYKVSFSSSENTEVNNVTINIEDSIDKLIQFGFHVEGSSNIQTYRDFLLQQPLRSVLQLLQSSSEIYSKEINHENLFKFTPQVAQSFRDTFLSSLYAAKVEVEKLNNGDENTLIESVFDTVTQDGRQDTGCYLRPQAIEDNLRNSFVALAASVAEFTQGKASSAINYMLQCSGSVSLFYYIKDELKRYHSDESLQLLQFKRYCGIGQHEDALNWAWHATAVLMSKKSSSSIKAGIIKLRTTKDSRNFTAYEFIKRNREISLPFNLGLIEVVGHNKQLYFSIFNILGVIFRLLKIGENFIEVSKIPSEINDDIDIIEIAPELWENVNNCLRKLEVTLGISAPNWSDFSNDMSSELEDKEIEDSDKEYIEKWVSAICKWLIISHKDLVNIQPSSIFLGKVWIRLYFSLVGVANSKENWHDLGKIISLYTHCLINAFLVEEEDHHFKVLNLNKEKFLTKKTNRQNPKNSLKPLNEKLKELKNNNFDGFPLTKMIANCPVIQGLITNNNDTYINETTFVSMLPNTIGKVMISGIDIGSEEEVVLKMLNENKNRLLDNRERLYHQRQVRKSKLNMAKNLLEENREKIIVNNNDLKNLKNILIQLDFNSDLNSDLNKNKIIEEIENKEHELSELEKNRVIIEKDIELENEILGSINSTIRELTSEIRKINVQIRELKEKGN
ncbi:P-loop NTPase fold protein [Acinetobacter sp. XS-4]|uniref:P-loop NTPase fold protein n=1 Tax=Acinetobacter sp. XS-4 TaxID=2923375 RepID=UPI00208F134E|nr:P-loop NTPase fold protein [Acinetobacter sp. XS-4]USP41293.1 P-loop NTPase fold protein [Acinetobacter sp. XS-4]